MNPFVIDRTLVDSKGTTTGYSRWVWCPACEEVHRFTELWGWNGRMENPTFIGSMLVKGGRHGSDYVCHSFLRDGVWDYLPDCTHRYAGDSLPMVPVPDWLMGGQES